MTLKDRWLSAMRSSTTRSIGSECDFAMSEGDADAFDPIGLLAYLAESLSTGYIRTCALNHGGYVTRQDAETLALAVGFDPSKLYELAMASDYGASWEELVLFVEMHCE